MKIRRTLRVLVLAAFGTLFSGCKPAPAPSTIVQSVKKLDGAPARVISARFSPDGATLLVHERRGPKAESPDKPVTFAISRRSIAGGGANDVIASEEVVLGFAPLGEGVAALMRPPLPAGELKRPDHGDSLAEELERHKAVRAVIHKTALYRVEGGGAPVRVSPEGRECADVVGSANGQWIAFSVAPVQSPDDISDDADNEIHVLGAKPGEKIKLKMKGAVRDLSPDGARVLVWRPPADADTDASSALAGKPKLPPFPSSRANALLMIRVKDQAVEPMPKSLKVDGADVDTAKLTVSFSGDGLLFRSAEGHIYKSAFDGSKAAQLAGALPGAGADAGTDPDAGGPPDAGALAEAGAPAANAGNSADAGAPPDQAKRVVGPKGTVFELREEGAAVVLSALAAGKPGAGEPIARFEGPLSSFGDVTFDPEEKRAALAMLSDTSRNGVFEPSHDDAEIFITSADPGSLAFGRAPVTTLSAELTPKIASAAGIPESSVRVVPSLGSVDVTVELPFISGEKAKALLNRALVAARAMMGVITQKSISTNVRVGPLELAVLRLSEEGGEPYIALVARGIRVADPEAAPLVLHNPTRTSAPYSSDYTLTGELENTGKEPTPPVEAFAMVPRGSVDTRTVSEVMTKLGSIAPGKRAKYSLKLTDVAYGASPSALFRAGGKRLTVLNQYSVKHSVDWLDTALNIYAAHGVWSEDRIRKATSFEIPSYRVHLTAQQAALAAFARDELFRSVGSVLSRHQYEFHNGEPAILGKPNVLIVMFAAPGGGGWRLKARGQIEKEWEPVERYEGTGEDARAWP